MKDQHLLVLGSQKLTELRDKIVCANDYFCLEELSEDASALKEDVELPQGPTNASNSAYFFIGNCFYDDLRHPAAKDTSREIISWAEEGDRIARSSQLDHFDAYLMEETSFEMLRFRLGWPYLYSHHGNCRHLVIFKDMRYVNRSIGGVVWWGVSLPEKYGRSACGTPYSLCVNSHLIWQVILYMPAGRNLQS